MSERRALSRDDAIRLGLNRYFTGKPCRRGHFSERIVLSYNCIECLKVTLALSKERTMEQARRWKRAWFERNRDAVRASGARWRRENPDKERAKSARPENVQRRREWKAKNRGKVLAYVKKRKHELRNRVPKWADRKAIEAIYDLRESVSRQTGILHHVDHEIPLFGEAVSGLHVESNLRVIPATENLRKNRRYEV